MAEKPNIVLVGFMGTGKSAVGRALARRLRRRYVDTDGIIRQQTCMSIAEIFSEFGETAFRDVETEAAREAAAHRNVVIATGGGILGRDENVEILRSTGILVCLTAQPEVIARRTRPWTSRPLLANAPDPEERVRTLLAERAERYALADYTIDSSDLEIPDVVERICAVLP